MANMPGRGATSAQTTQLEKKRSKQKRFWQQKEPQLHKPQKNKLKQTQHMWSHHKPQKKKLKQELNQPHPHMWSHHLPATKLDRLLRYHLQKAMFQRHLPRFHLYGIKEMTKRTHGKISQVPKGVVHLVRLNGSHHRRDHRHEHQGPTHPHWVTEWPRTLTKSKHRCSK